MVLIFSTERTNDQSIAFNYLMTVINGVQTEWSTKGGLCASSAEWQINYEICLKAILQIQATYNLSMKYLLLSMIDSDRLR